MATITPPSLPSPDSFAWKQIQDAARYFNANRESIERAARMANKMRPYIEMMAPTIRAIESMRQDMSTASILARQHAAFTAMIPTIPLPTDAELAGTQDRMAELVPETDEECEQVAEQAAEIQADPEGKKLVEQLTGWTNEIVARLGDVAAKHKTAVGLTVLAWLCLFVVPQADVDRMALFCVAAAVLLMLFPPSGQ